MAVDFSKRKYEVQMAILDIFAENLEQVMDQEGFYEGMNREAWIGAQKAINHLNEQIFGKYPLEGENFDDP